MLGKKISESLTARIFLLTVLILFGAGAITFGLIAWAAPVTYTAAVNEELRQQVDDVVGQLEKTRFEDCGPVIDGFIRLSGAEVMVLGEDGRIATTGSSLAVEFIQDGETGESSSLGSGAEWAAGDVAAAGDEAAVAWTAQGLEGNEMITVTMAEENTITSPIRFADQEEIYSIWVTPRIMAENVAVKALAQIAPWLMAALLGFSVFWGWVYSRYITRPILRLQGIAGRMAGLEFSWKCEEKRRDEIGDLGRSLDLMAGRLSAALKELEAANAALRREVEQQQELERQRTAFFSAASHELKTPVTILKGQLWGMLEGIGVYQDRDKYLLRCLQTAGRMEKLIQEMLSISRMESGKAEVKMEQVELSGLIKKQIALDQGLFEQRGQQMVISLTPETVVIGDAVLLARMVENLLSNAAFYSPEGAKIRVWCGKMENCPCFTVENTGVQIGKEALSRLFEPFYREENSRNRRTGGSGLGLYLVKMISERHDAVCKIENIEDGVRASVRFSKG